MRRQHRLRLTLYDACRGGPRFGMTIRPRCVTRVWFIALWLSALTGWVAAQRLAAQAPPPAVGKAAQPGQEQSLSGTAGERPLDFNWDVRPILSDNCFRCHGPDAGNRRGDLRLDTADGAYAERRPGVHAVVPGTPDASEMLKRVTHANAALRMPPASTNKVLSPREIAVLRRWVVEGARYAPHWAFVPPTLPALPAVRASRPDLTPLDRFIASRLEREGLELSPRADKETLINRVSLTLTGLPPTLAEVDAFLKDQRPTAYEALVDRLLASPAYAEHVAQNWLTVARFAETDGFLGDESNRLFWPYRDWVIGAMRRNMPFNAFGTWQLAGDLLPNPTEGAEAGHSFFAPGKTHHRRRRDRGRVPRRIHDGARDPRRERVPGADRRLCAVSRSQVRPDFNKGVLLARGLLQQRR